MKKLIFLLLIFSCIFYSINAMQPDNKIYRIISKKAEINKILKIGKFEVVVQVGENEINRFTMHRVVKLDKHYMPVRSSLLKGALILMPGGGSNFDMYLLGKDGESIATYLALKNIDVYGYSPRTKGIKYGYFDNNDSSEMKSWGINTYLDDLDYILNKVMKRHKKRPVVGGMSLGAILSIAAVDRRPHSYEGAIIWEGTLYYDSPVQELFEERVQYLDYLLQNGQYYDYESYTLIKTLVSLQHYYPDIQSPFEPSLTNREYFTLFATSPVDPPLGEAPGYTYAAGDLINGFYYADMDLLLDFANQINDYEPNALIRDISGGFAGERTFTGNLDLFTGKVLSIQAGLGFGSHAEDNLQLFTNANIERYIKPEYGHGDMLVPKNYIEIICEPIWEWLENNIIPNWDR